MINKIELLEVSKIKDPRGNLGIIEEDNIPFNIRRVYYLYDVPSDSKRGGHAHKKLYQLMIALSGSFDVILHDGEEQQKVTLNKPDKGLFIKPGVWRELENFSSGAVCLVLASEIYQEDDYIRDFDQFVLFKTR
ncbi:sugar 3,4-ketoisomerase [Aquimarina sp. M1]